MLGRAGILININERIKVMKVFVMSEKGTEKIRKKQIYVEKIRNTNQQCKKRRKMARQKNGQYQKTAGN
jgi:hypothetical protein